MDLSAQNDYYDQRFHRVDQQGVRMIETVFEECTFERCNFQGAQFVGCRFTDCRFMDCDLSAITVVGTRFNGVRFERCKVAGIDWTVAAWSKFVAEAPLSFDSCLLNYGSFLALTLHKLRITDCTAHEVDFREAALGGADFGGTDLASSFFHNTILKGANFVGSINYLIDARHNDLSDARVSLPDALLLLEAMEVAVVERES
ncbi:MAG: pentapeptide repeat-containing protein [Anaerolineales bacterium]|nr:pentapeptide repeat-containing protein [Anaerolineales bacterium]MCB9129065.1 pentapeptide repeat-containing protein [Ardenticatenales bacterium]